MDILRQSFLAKILFIFHAYITLVLVPIRAYSIYVSGLPVIVYSAFDANTAWSAPAQPDKDPKVLRSEAKSLRDSTKSELGSQSDQEAYIGNDQNGFGQYTNRSSWSDRDVKRNAMLYEIDVDANDESPEGQVYDFLKQQKNSSEFANRDRKYKNIGDALIFKDPNEEAEKAYQDISDEIEGNMVCTSKVTRPAVFETVSFDETKNCAVNTGDAWLSAECKVERELFVPAIKGNGRYWMADNGYTRVFESELSDTHSFDVEGLEYFRSTWDLDFVNNFTEKADFEYQVNGVSQVFDYEDVKNGIMTFNSELLNEGINTVKAIVHPVGYAGEENLPSCNKENINTVIGDAGGIEFYKSLSLVGNQIQWYLVDYLTCTEHFLYVHRGLVSADYGTAKNILKSSLRDLESCSEVSASRGYQNSLFSWSEKKEYVIDEGDKVVTPTGDIIVMSPAIIAEYWVGCLKVNLRAQSNQHYYFPPRERDGSTSISGRTRWKHEYYNGYPVSETAGWFRSTHGWKHDHHNPDENLVCTETVCSYLGKRYALSWSEPLEVKVKTDAKSYVVTKYSESIPNCADQTKLTVTRTDGNTISELDSVAFPDSSIQEDGVSNKYWECTDFSPERKVGRLNESSARASEIGSALPDLFPDINGESINICYQARLRNFAVDISDLSVCPDGGVSCYYNDDVSINTGVTTLVDSGVTVGEYLRDKEDCSELETNSSCKLKNEICQIYSPASNQCVRYSRDYTCSDVDQIMVSPEITSTECESVFPCLGNEGNSELCEYEDETSDSFNEAAIALNVSTMARGDQNCISDDPSTCVIFSGEKKSCRSAVLYGSESCCKDPKTVSKIDYVQALIAVYKFDYVENTVDKLTNDYLISPLNDYLVDPIWDVTGRPLLDNVGRPIWNKIYGSFTSLISSPADTVSLSSNTVSAYGGLVSQQGQDLVSSSVIETTSWNLAASFTDTVGRFSVENLGSVGNWMFDSVLRDASGQVAGTVSSSGTVTMTNGATYESVSAATDSSGQALTESFDFSSSLSNAFSTVMLAYQVYTISKLIYGLLTQCKKEEVKTSSDVAVGNCTFMGVSCTKKSIFGCVEETKTFCCYMSPLARIIHEQSMNTNQHPFSSKREHYSTGACRGFWFSEFQALDFNAPGFSLDEWVGLMMDVDLLPKEDNLDEYFGEERITKSVARYYGKENEIGTASERSDDIVGALGDVEDIRLVQRETVLAAADAEPFKRDCGYVHSISSGSSYDGAEEVVYGSSGQEIVVSDCALNLKGNSYPHEYSQCSSGGWNVWFTGRDGERVTLANCSADSEVAEAAFVSDKEWQLCGYDHDTNNGYSVDKYQLVDNGTVVSDCQQRSHSRPYRHVWERCSERDQSVAPMFTGALGEIVKADSCVIY